jgi:hypothetical protein
MAGGTSSRDCDPCFCQFIKKRFDLAVRFYGFGVIVA